MTLQSEVEMKIMRLEVKRKQAEELAEKYREALMKAVDLLETVDQAYEEATTKDVMYYHSQIWGSDPKGWAYELYQIVKTVKYPGIEKEEASE